MSVLHNELNLDSLAASTDSAWIKDQIAYAFWTWYYQHENDKLLYAKKLIFLSITVRVKHLKPVFVLLFGDRVVND